MTANISGLLLQKSYLINLKKIIFQRHGSSLTTGVIYPKLVS